jgi:hypothetical protein
MVFFLLIKAPLTSIVILWAEKVERILPLTRTHRCESKSDPERVNKKRKEHLPLSLSLSTTNASNIRLYSSQRKSSGSPRSYFGSADDPSARRLEGLVAQVNHTG